jgi:phenylalanyl-tRNA synthetase beta chain
MLTVLATNINRKNGSARFFECSKRFITDSLPLTKAPEEIPTMGIGIYGEEEDFFTLKGMIEEIIALYSKKASYARANEPFLHPGRQAMATIDGETVAVFGEVHPETAKKYDISDRIYVAEVYIDKLFTLKTETKIYKPLPKYPSVTRDFAFICKKELPVGEIIDTMEKAAGKLCENVELFDVYEGSQIEAGKKSVAFSVYLRSADSTLTDKEIEEISNKIIKKLESIGAELRK